MYTALNCGVIGVKSANLEDGLSLAKKFGFQGLELDGAEIADLVEKEGKEAVVEKFHKSGVKPAAFGLRTSWRGEEAEFQASLAELSRVATACSSIGSDRTFTWIMPASDDRGFDENLAFHESRLRPIAQVLKDSGCRLGLEFIGPKTIRERSKHTFIYQMLPMLEWGRTLGSNVGLMLDCWHWYTSHGSREELLTLRADDVVSVHVNDAPKGVDTDSQQDGIRSVPGATGVIDIEGFIGALKTIGYDGPITPEPFTSELKDLPTDEDRLTAVSEGLQKIMKFS